MPTTVESVRTYLGLVPARPVDDDALSAAVGAANGMVAAYRIDLPALNPPDNVGVSWPAQCDFAATMQAGRLYGRRGSVQGVAAFQDVGVSMLPRLDPDVRALLQLGEYQPSVVS